jgi:hypothetical protein
MHFKAYQCWYLGSVLERKLNLKGESKSVLSNFKLHFHNDYGIQIFRYRFFIERVLKAILCDDKHTSPYLHKSWVIYMLSSFSFLLLGLCLWDFIVHSNGISPYWCFVLYCIDYSELLLLCMTYYWFVYSLIVIILFIESFVCASRCAYVAGLSPSSSSIYYGVWHVCSLVFFFYIVIIICLYNLDDHKILI